MIPASPAQSRRRTSVLSLVAAIPAAVVSVMALIRGERLNLFEFGTLVAGGDQVIGHGKMLYTDVFAFYGPLTYLEPALASRIGTGLVGLQIESMAVLLLGAIASYRLTVRLCQRPFLGLVVPCSLALVGGLVPRATPGILALLCLAALESEGVRAWAPFVGFWAAVGVLYFQDAGVAIVAALALVSLAGVVNSRVRSLLWTRNSLPILIGGAVPVTLVSGWLVSRQAFGAALYQMFVFPNTVYVERSAFGYLSELVASWNGLNLVTWLYKATFYALPYVVVVGAAVFGAALAWLQLFRGAAPVLPVTTAVAATYALLQLRTLFASADESKLAAASMPVVIVAVALAARGWSPVGRRAGTFWRRAAVVALVAFLLAWPMQKRARIWMYATPERIEVATGKLAGIGLTGTTSPTAGLGELRHVIDTVQSLTRPGDPIFVAPTSPLLYFLSERGNATRYDYLDPTYIKPAVDVELERALRGRAPTVVIIADGPNAWNRSAAQIAPRTMGYVAEEYHVQEIVGPYRVLVRGRP